MVKRNLKEQNKDLEINIIDLIHKFDPSDTSKYTKFLTKILIKELDDHSKRPKATLISTSDNLKPKSSNFFENILIRYLSEIYGEENMGNLISFHKHCQENRIIGENIDDYNSWDEISRVVSLADLKKNQKLLQKEVQKVFETEEWLVLKPLTIDSSLVYGSGTKWCTASRHNKEYFYRYSGNGVLCYAISKIDGDKFGIYYDISVNDFSIWDVTDKRIDSVESTIPMDVITKVYKFMKGEKCNYEYFSKLEKEKCNEIRKSYELADAPTAQVEEYVV